VSFIELWIFETLTAKKLTYSIIDADFVVNFDSLVKDRRKNVQAIGSPVDANWAVGFGLAYLFVGIESPKVNFSCKVTETSNQNGLGEGTDSNCVSVAFAILKEGVRVLIIESSCRRLHTWHNNESLSIRYPDDIMNHSIKYWHENSSFASLKLNILACMLSIVAFSRWINKILRPD